MEITKTFWFFTGNVFPFCRTAPRSRPALCALFPGCEHLHNAVTYVALLVPVPSNWTHAFRVSLTSSSSLFVHQTFVGNRTTVHYGQQLTIIGIVKSLFYR